MSIARSHRTPVASARGFVVLAALGLAATACGQGGSGAAQSTSRATAAAVPPPAAIAQQGYVTFCSSLANPPREFMQDGKPSGSDIQIGEALARQMGVTVRWKQYLFDGLIPALQSQNCDAIVEEMFIKPERQQVIDQLPFAQSLNATVVPKGNPLGITGINETESGRKVGVPRGDTYGMLMAEYNKKLAAAGKPPIQIVPVPSTDDMFNQLLAGTVDAAGATTTSAAYYIAKSNGRLQLGGDPFYPLQDGIGVRKGNAELSKALQQALANIMKDGTYQKIWKSWNLDSNALPTS